MSNDKSMTCDRYKWQIFRVDPEKANKHDTSKATCLLTHKLGRAHPRFSETKIPVRLLK